MSGAALPWWAANGVDRVHGGYVEQLTMDGRDAGADFKRTRVTARQIYVFSHGYMLGFDKGLDLARHGIDFLLTKTWAGEDKGFARLLTRKGALLDPTPDLYDHAFVLFALSWFFKASGDSDARDWLHRTLDYAEAHLRHPAAGFRHELPAKGPRQQNPHMHLTEAMLAAFDATGEQRFSDVAKELVGLFQTRFFDLKSRTLGEYFTDDLKRAAGDQGRVVEPGHQFEWAWILNSCRKTFGLDLGAEIRAAAGFAETHGVDPATCAVFNQVRDDGTPIDKGSRTWPNCERIKASIALHELDGADPSDVVRSSASLLLDRYLAHTPRGTWIDAFDAEGNPLANTIPASTLYHIFLAFAEVLRVSD
jgi:mannose/cellobiose epimerase-like protein (N-acyl-D-glucosamine 2-epimerase family)